MSNIASPDLLIIIAIFTAIFALGALIFGYLGYEAANKAQIKINYRLEVLENGLKHFLGNSFEEMRALRSELSGGFRDLRNESNQKLQGLIDKNDVNSKALLETLITSLEKLREGNEQKLEQMRATVDEKLQGTLTERLGEGFKQVSDHLEKVHKGLGEMQNLATGVGDLKRVLTNVKSRGTWGEVQL